jgi:hypothetical protein
MHYITIPPPVRLFHQDTGAPILVEKDVQAEADFATVIRHLTNEMLKMKSLDLLEVIELRVALTRAEIGQEVKIEDVWWEKLVEAFRRPDGFHIAYLVASKPHVLAITNAPTKPRD